jgi:hypothetical protein
MSSQYIKIENSRAHLWDLEKYPHNFINKSSNFAIDKCDKA